MTPHASQPLPEPPEAPSCGGGGSFALVHPDIVRTHILSRLDGPSLTSVACASPQLHSLSSEGKLWEDVCAATWPSTAEPRLHYLICTFRSGFRSFYSDACPLLRLPAISTHPLPPPRMITKLISAVDIFHGDNLLFSKVQETESSTPWFMSTPFRIDLIEKKEPPLKTVIPYTGQNSTNLLKHLEEELRLSWILIDPAGKRAVSLPSPGPVSVGVDLLNGGIRVLFSSILEVGREEFESIGCHVSLACRGDADGMMEMREISMTMEDTEGRGVTGESSTLIIAAATEGGQRRAIGWRGEGGGGGGGGEGIIAMKERFEEFGEMKRRRKQRQQRRDAAVDMACLSGGIAMLAGFFFWFMT